MTPGHRCRLPQRHDVGFEDGHPLFHDTRALDHLRQEHLAFAEEIANRPHPLHHGPLDDIEGAAQLEAGLLDVTFNMLHDPVN